MATTYRFGPKFRLPLNVLKKKIHDDIDKSTKHHSFRNRVQRIPENPRESQRIQNPKDREKKREKAK